MNLLKAKANFYSLDDGNQNDVSLGANIPKDWIKNTQAKYDWNNFDQYDNRMWEYMYKLFDDVVENCGIVSVDEIWNKLNRSQKTFWAFLTFTGDTDNGGIYQFLLNKSKFICAVSEMWNEIEMEEISKDYKVLLSELSEESGIISEIEMAFNGNDEQWEERLISLEDNDEKFEIADKIEDYFYQEGFKKDCHKKMADYIEVNIDSFIL